LGREQQPGQRGGLNAGGVLQTSSGHRGDRAAHDRPALPSPLLGGVGKRGGLAGAGLPDEDGESRRRCQSTDHVQLLRGQVAGTLANDQLGACRESGLVPEVGRETERVLFHGEQLGGRPAWSVLAGGGQAHDVAVPQDPVGSCFEGSPVDGETGRQRLAQCLEQVTPVEAGGLRRQATGSE
jgi:hypothetical protein